MGFSRTVREQVLVSSARHCCVCHRYRGLKVEVHHIVSKHDGGEDSLQNAILLCFDCHADAGRYNIHHPKGTKFSPSELRRHRDRWYEMVAGKSLDVPGDANLLHCQYLICRNYGAFVELCYGEFGKIPYNNMMLLDNEILHYMKWLLGDGSVRYREHDALLESDLDPKAALTAHPEAAQHRYHVRPGLGLPRQLNC